MLDPYLHFLILFQMSVEFKEILRAQTHNFTADLHLKGIVLHLRPKTKSYPHQMTVQTATISMNNDVALLGKNYDHNMTIKTLQS
jgi:hypothetical protein